MLTQQTIQEAVRDVVKKYDIKEAYLFGSCTRGEQIPQSDIDLRFLCGQTLRVQDLYHVEKELENKLGKPLEIVSAHQKNYGQDSIKESKQKK